jgi:glycerol-3-phosphate acyltransferase PlsY
VPIALWFLATPQLAGVFALMSVILFIKHRANIQRLASGTEGRIGARG